MLQATAELQIVIVLNILLYPALSDTPPPCKLAVSTKPCQKFRKIPRRCIDFCTSIHPCLSHISRVDIVLPVLNQEKRSSRSLPSLRDSAQWSTHLSMKTTLII